MAEYTLFGSGAVGSSTRTDGPYTVGTEFYVTSKAWLLAVRFYNPTAAVQTVTYQAWTVNSGGTTGTALFTSGSFSTAAVAEWNRVALTPVALTAGTRCRVGFRATRFRQTDNYFSTGAGGSGVTNGILVAPNRANATNNVQGSYATGASIAFPATASGTIAQCWFSDVVVSDVDPTGQSQTNFHPFLLG